MWRICSNLANYVYLVVDCQTRCPSFRRHWNNIRPSYIFEWNRGIRSINSDGLKLLSVLHDFKSRNVLHHRRGLNIYTSCTYFYKISRHEIVWSEGFQLFLTEIERLRYLYLSLICPKDIWNSSVLAEDTSSWSCKNLLVYIMASERLAAFASARPIKPDRRADSWPKAKPNP